VDAEPRQISPAHIYAVHSVMADEVRPTQAVYTDPETALDYAAALSNDEEVLAASVVRFTLDELGTRRNVAMFVNGQRQRVPHLSDCRSVHGGGRNPTG
jgi:hypothetical protein